MNSIHDWFYDNDLVRNRADGILGGVCAGLADKLGTTPWTARWLLIIVLLLLPGSQLLVYPVLWLLMPDERYVPAGRPAPHGPTA